MEGSGSGRRDFLSTSASALGGGWLAAHLPLLAALSACAREAAESGAGYVALTDAQALTLEAFASRILPSEEGSPGAVEAGAVHFVDLVLDRGPFAGMRPLVIDGLADLDRRAGQEGAADFAALPADRRDAVLRAVEDTPFFGAARMLVVAGTFSDPMRGGNQDGVGWALLGIDHQPAYRPPFGYYDAELASGAGEG